MMGSMLGVIEWIGKEFEQLPPKRPHLFKLMRCGIVSGKPMTVLQGEWSPGNCAFAVLFVTDAYPTESTVYRQRSYLCH